MRRAKLSTWTTLEPTALFVTEFVGSSKNTVQLECSGIAVPLTCTQTWDFYGIERKTICMKRHVHLTETLNGIERICMKNMYIWQ
jgi:hypothetical protein